VIEEVYDEFFKVISLLPYGLDFMISGGRKNLSQFICSILNKKEKEERDLWGLYCPLYLLVYIVGISVYCRNNKTRQESGTFTSSQIMILVVITVE